jgi:type II secretory pathway predicted ATPase ExeA
VHRKMPAWFGGEPRGKGPALQRRHLVAWLTRLYVPNPAIGSRGLYVTIVAALGGKPRFHKAEVMAQTADLLAAEAAERHRRVVFVIDDAHLLTPDQLEQLRLLTNSEMDSASPFVGLLVGQPTLARQLRMGMFAAQPSTNASPPATRSRPWTWPTPPAICVTT